MQHSKNMWFIFPNFILEFSSYGFTSPFSVLLVVMHKSAWRQLFDVITSVVNAVVNTQKCIKAAAAHGAMPAAVIPLAVVQSATAERGVICALLLPLEDCPTLS